MAARKIEVMSQDEISLQSFEMDQDEMLVNESQVELNQIEIMPASNVISLSDFRKSMGYTK